MQFVLNRQFENGRSRFETGDYNGEYSIKYTDRPLGGRLALRTSRGVHRACFERQADAQYICMKSPAFQFYPDDFIGGTVAFTAEETGAYIRLLCHQWGNGKIPSEKTVLERIAGGPVSEAVLSKFKNGKQQRLEKERKKQREYREKQRINGAKGGRPSKRLRLGLGYSGFSKTEPKKSSPSPSPSPSPISNKENKIFKDGADISVVVNRLGTLFKRNGNDRLNCIVEQGIAEICRRPAIIAEISEIENFKKREQYFPQSLETLVTGWQKTLDRARANPILTPEQIKRKRELEREFDEL